MLQPLPQPLPFSGRSVQKAVSIACSGGAVTARTAAVPLPRAAARQRAWRASQSSPAPSASKAPLSAPRTNSKAPPRQVLCLTCRSRTGQKANKHKSAHLGRRSTWGFQEDALNARASRLSRGKASSPGALPGAGGGIG